MKMRKFILLAMMAATALPGTAIAQQRDLRDRNEVRHDRREVRQDRRELRRDQRELRRDRRAYAAPYRNWRYRPVTVGFRLQPAFYGSRYYITDYGTYRLQPPRNRWTRWIRYGDDLLLVNTRTGRVLDVVHYRYW
jgi:Ni/Co efflux regulator RcnB